MNNDELVSRAIGIKKVKTDDLKHNPHNPRLLFDKADLSILQESIAKVGILVPLTVYREKSSGRFVILDGQRRWMCAIKLKLQSMPVNEVAEPSIVQNIVTMFQIHKLRKDWELMPTALKLEVLMEELDEKNERKLAKLTGLEEAVVLRCKKLLSYNKKYHEMMLEPDPDDRQRADFFIELYPVRNDREVNRFEWFSKDKFTDAMLKKQKAGGIKSVTDFRIIKQRISNAVKANKRQTISKRLKEFTDNPELTPDHLDIASASILKKSKLVSKAAEKLISEVIAIDIDEFYGQEEMWAKLSKLSMTIRKKLKDLGWRAEE